MFCPACTSSLPNDAPCAVCVPRRNTVVSGAEGQEPRGAAFDSTIWERIMFTPKRPLLPTGEETSLPHRDEGAR